MAYSKSYFLGFVYGVPLGFSACVLLLMTVINKHVNWLLLRSILGIDLNDDKKKKSTPESKRESSANLTDTTLNPATKKGRSDSLKTYLYIDFKEETKEDSARLTFLQRIVSDVLVSAILGVFVVIIFNALVLTSESVKNNDQCPDFDASCFGNDGTQDVGPFDCKQGNTTSFTANSNSWWCVGWVYQDMGAKDVLDTLGTCGGLLGIVSSIVPIVYYLSYHKKCCCPFSVTWIVPALAPAALGFLFWYTRPLGPSLLAIITLSVVIGMVFVGWVWAAERSFRGSKYCSKWSSKCDRGKMSCFVRRCSILDESSKSYPWCCSCCSSETSIFYRCCYYGFSCCRPCLDRCCENEAEKFQNPKRIPSSRPVSTVIQVQPQSSTKPSRSTTNEYPKTAW